jgi:selenium-dependent xanthine dehydrogenase
MQLIVNGVTHDLDVAADAKLVDVLRYRLGLTGTKIGCGEGQCGSCTVLLEGRPIRACSFPVQRAAGKRVLTIEGLAASWGDPDELHPLQQAFVDQGAVQCGYCTPGMIMRAAALWNNVTSLGDADVTEDDIKRALGRNVCRCTGYASVLRAVRSAFHQHRTGNPLPLVDTGTAPPFRVIGHSYARPDVVAKVTGTGRFADDVSFPGMLIGATLRAGHPHARIVAIDTSQADALPGVHAVLTHKDVPGSNRHGLVYADWPVLCDDKVRYMGDAVALVAADSAESAAQAIELIGVQYEPLPVMSSAQEARQPNATLLHEEWPDGNLLAHIKVRHGDVDRGFAEADVVVEHEYRTPIYEHMFMEPECSVAVPPGYDAEHPKLTVYVGSQIPFADRDQIATALNLAPEQVRVVGTLMGGGFGGKEDITGQIHAALLARATGRPVKVRYSRSESMLVHPKRHATTIRLRTGAKRDGTLTAVQAELIGDAGAYASLSTKVLTRTTTHATGPYQVPHAKIDCYAMYTNNPPAGAFRGFGVTQSAFAVEQNMDILAHELGIDPFEMRRKNGLRVGSVTATGQTLHESVGLLDCLDVTQAEVRTLDASPNPPLPLKNPRIAWGVAAAYKNTGLGGGADDAAGAELEVFPDGTAEIRCGSADMGQGLTAVVAQCVAEELGLAYERVGVLLSDTDRSPDGGPTTASRQTFVTGNAARLAARSMRDRLAVIAAARWNIAADRIRFEDGVLHAEGHTAAMAEVVAWLQQAGQSPRLTYHYRAPETLPLGEGGDMHVAFSFGVQAAQVAVDQETGEVHVLRVVAACDAGRALNPQALLGQIEGGVVMALGTTLTEEYQIEHGRPQTLRWADYRVPLIGAMPEMHVRIVEHPLTTGPYGAKGIGELPSIPTAPAICNAIYNAVGIRVQRLPVKPTDLKKELAQALSSDG